MRTDKIDRHWRCDCGAAHFLSVTWYADDTPDRLAEIDGYLDVEGNFRRTLRHRLQMAWNVIRSGHADTRVGLVLDAAKAREIAAVLTEFADTASPAS